MVSSSTANNSELASTLNCCLKLNLSKFMQALVWCVGKCICIFEDTNWPKLCSLAQVLERDDWLLSGRSDAVHWGSSPHIPQCPSACTAVCPGEVQGHKVSQQICLKTSWGVFVYIWNSLGFFICAKALNPCLFHRYHEVSSINAPTKLQLNWLLHSLLSMLYSPVT